MKAVKRVKKLVSTLSLVSFSVAMLLANVGFAATSAKSARGNTAGQIRQGKIQQRSQHNFISLKNFNSELNIKVKEYQKVAAFTSLETAQQEISYKADGTKKTFSGSVIMTYSQSAVDHKDGTSQASQSAMAILTGALSDNYSLTGRISVSQNLKDTEDQESNGVSDLGVILSQKHIELTNWLKGGFGVSSTLPTSKYSRDFQNFEGSLGGSYTFALTEAVLMKGLSTSLSLGAARNFHRYETDATGRILNPYSVREIVSAGYSKGAFSFSFEFLHRHAWNYSGTVSQVFEHTEEITYSVTPQWGVALGHTNGGSWLAPNRQDSNLKLINENDSIIYGSMSLVF